MQHELVSNRYRILRRLAVGGMGEIFLARQVDVTDRLVILKTLLPHLASQADFVAQLFDEARVVATLNHPNIVAVYEVGASLGTYYLAMEYVDGITVAQLLERTLERGERLPWQLAARIVSDAAVGLQHAHDAVSAGGVPLGIVHRDVSPQNIMVRCDGVTKVVDFGIARAANRTSRTETGMLKGKLAYMAPEQLDGRATPASDQYALGVTFWEMLAHRRLFEGSDVDIVRAMARNEVGPPSRHNPEIPPQLDALVMRMLAEPIAQRFPRIAEVVTELAAIVPSLPAHQVAIGALVERSRDAALASAAEAPAAIADFAVALDDSMGPRTVKLPAAAALALPTPPRVPKRRRTALLGVGGLVIVAVIAGLLLRPHAGEPSAPLAAAPVEVPTTQAPAATPAPGPPPIERRATPEPPAVTPVVPPAARARPSAAPVTSSRHTTKHAASALAESAAAYGTVTLKTTPWTLVSIDGRSYGSTPLFRVRLTAGAHEISLVNRDAAIHLTRHIDVAAEQNLKLDLNLAN